ncbi:hypothetical protein [Pseudoalteromonas luteoviolacea]|uniref:hypothetical protein n=1 Tax=Pseudoalteromonas luteoviolacea TaxID=43657 RepID=UPI00114DC0E5|nr:hypothetical protein [Pseudoalteromonas luteoviolacea]TQF67667.1 hypothetical protein FLM44_21025 [Pseudoalteromonas luteoviolacea]
MNLCLPVYLVRLLALNGPYLLRSQGTSIFRNMFGLQAGYGAKQTNCITSTDVNGTEIEHSKMTNKGCSLNKRVRVKSNIKTPTKTNAISKTEARKQ